MSRPSASSSWRSACCLVYTLTRDPILVGNATTFKHLNLKDDFLFAFDIDNEYELQTDLLCSFDVSIGKVQ